MKRFYTKAINNVQTEIEIVGDEFKHLKNVMRLNVGDEVICFCGDGKDYFCSILNITNSCALLKINKSEINKADLSFNLTVFQGLPKGDKFDLIVQKLTEIGVNKIIPFESEFTVAKENSNKIERLNKVAIEACKQCGRATPLNVSNVVKFQEMLKLINNYDLSIVCYEKEDSCVLSQVNLDCSNIALIIGSEGGFSSKEISELVKNNCLCVGLGKRILRCETAGIVASSFIVLSKEGKK